MDTSTYLEIKSVKDEVEKNSQGIEYIYNELVKAGIIKVEKKKDEKTP